MLRWLPAAADQSGTRMRCILKSDWACSEGQLQTGTLGFAQARLLGTSSCGDAFLGLLDGQPCCVKRLASAGRPGALQQLAASIASLHHPNIITLLGWGLSGNTGCLVTPLAPVSAAAAAARYAPSLAGVTEARCMQHGSLESSLAGDPLAPSPTGPRYRLLLDTWQRRVRCAAAMASGLAHLQCAPLHADRGCLLRPLA